jgi:hypothetical protein
MGVVTIVNRSGEMIVGGELEAYQRRYPIETIPAGQSRDIRFHVPWGEARYWVLLQTKTGQRLRTGGDSWGYWGLRDRFVIRPEGYSVAQNYFGDDPNRVWPWERSIPSPAGAVELLVWQAPNGHSEVGLARFDRARTYDFFSGDQVRDLSVRWLDGRTVSISAEAGRNFHDGQMGEADGPPVKVIYRLPADRAGTKGQKARPE